jgi:hypothetical protein
MITATAGFSFFKIPSGRHVALKLTVLMEFAPHAD